jgi:hypothetical protein
MGPVRRATAAGAPNSPAVLTADRKVGQLVTAVLPPRYGSGIAHRGQTTYCLNARLLMPRQCRCSDVALKCLMSSERS